MLWTAQPVKLHSRAEVEQCRAAAQLAAQVLAMIAPHVRSGVSTGTLDRICHDFIVNELKAIPANIGYQGFPKTICASRNHVVCHGIPSADEVLRDGDILNIDVAVVRDGWYGDTARMYCVGEIKPRTRLLVDTTYAAMRAGILQVRPGATLGDVGQAIEAVARARGFSVVREYCGHGVGRVYHDEPQVLHFGQRGQGLRLKPGMIFTIEPMLNAGKGATVVRPDGWTVVSRDRSMSAQWEHMVAVTEHGFDVLSAWPDGTGDYAAIEPARTSSR